MSILIVDDEPFVRTSLARVLRSAGYDVQVAEHGREALAVLSGGPLPSLVLIDLAMPVMNGATLFAALRADERLASVPVVFMTGGKPPRTLGATVLAKPPTVRELLDVVDAYERRSA